MAEATIAMAAPGDGQPELEILDPGASMTDFDSDLEAIFEDATAQGGTQHARATQLLDAPPKDDEDLVVELLDG